MLPCPCDTFHVHPARSSWYRPLLIPTSLSLSFGLLCVLLEPVSGLSDFPDLGFVPRVKGIIITRMTIVGMIAVNCDCAQSVIKFLSIATLLSLSPHGSATPSPQQIFWQAGMAPGIEGSRDGSDQLVLSVWS